MVRVEDFMYYIVRHCCCDVKFGNGDWGFGISDFGFGNADLGFRIYLYLDLEVLPMLVKVAKKF